MMEFNEYWVVEAYMEAWGKWTLSFDFPRVLERLELTESIGEKALVLSMAYRIVHYTGTGAEVAAEWDKEGERAK